MKEQDGGQEECPNCHLHHPNPCPFVLGQPCVCCGEPVTAVSMGGDTICGYCDSGSCHRKPKTPRCTTTHRKAQRRFYEIFFIPRSRN